MLVQSMNVRCEAQQWTDLEVLDLPECSRGAFRGRRPKIVSPFHPSFIVLWPTYSV